MTRRWMWSVLVAGLAASACGSSDEAPTGTGGASPTSGGAPSAGSVPNAGGALTGGNTGTGGNPSTGGAPVAPGQLTCAGTLCKGGGRCASDGSCPAFLGGCFSPTGGPQTCRGYCESVGSTCAEKSCLPDGTGTEGGYTWVSFMQAECPASSVQELVSFDTCSTTIGLSRAIPPDQAIRCCCRG